jgi:hypothetical protein
MLSRNLVRAASLSDSRRALSGAQNSRQSIALDEPGVREAFLRQRGPSQRKEPSLINEARNELRISKVKFGTLWSAPELIRGQRFRRGERSILDTD